MQSLIRDATIGQAIRYLTGNKVLLYPEEKADFKCPPWYAEPDLTVQPQVLTPPPLISNDLEDVEKNGLRHTEATKAVNVSPTAAHSLSGLDRAALERSDTSHSDRDRDLEKAVSNRSRLSRVSTHSALASAHTQADLQASFSEVTAGPPLVKEQSRPIIPQRTADGTILVDWYTTDDVENPQQWSTGKKAIASTQIYLYTFAVYLGSAIYTPSVGGIMEEFGVSVETASLGLSLYVLAYGTGPLLWSPPLKLKLPT